MSKYEIHYTNVAGYKAVLQYDGALLNLKEGFWLDADFNYTHKGCDCRIFVPWHMVTGIIKVTVESMKPIVPNCEECIYETNCDLVASHGACQFTPISKAKKNDKEI